MGWYLHACRGSFHRWVRRLAWRWRHQRKFSRVLCCIFFCLNLSWITFIIEAVDAVDTGALVVASQHEEILRIFDLVGQHEADRLHWLFSSVHIVSQEQIVRVSRKSGILEQFDEVRVLSMDVTWVDRAVPQILMGASSSRSMGCSRKISLALRQIPLI